MDDYYAILGLPRNATQEQIKSRFRRLTKEWHPDQFQDPIQKRKAEQKFSRITEAYNELSKATRRSNYDRARSERPRAKSRSFSSSCLVVILLGAVLVFGFNRLRNQNDLVTGTFVLSASRGVNANSSYAGPFLIEMTSTSWFPKNVAVLASLLFEDGSSCTGYGVSMDQSRASFELRPNQTTAWGILVGPCWEGSSPSAEKVAVIGCQIIVSNSAIEVDKQKITDLDSQIVFGREGREPVQTVDELGRWAEVVPCGPGSPLGQVTPPATAGPEN